MNNKNIVIILIILFFGIGLFVGKFLFNSKDKNYNQSQNQVVIKEDSLLLDKKQDKQSISEENQKEKENLIKLVEPKANSIVKSPFEVSGFARGYWFFEATFPIVVTDYDGVIIGNGYAETSEEWMTEDFVPFFAKIEFTYPKLYDYGTLILQKSNPSGLPQNDDALEIPIKFAQ